MLFRFHSCSLAAAAPRHFHPLPQPLPQPLQPPSLPTLFLHPSVTERSLCTQTALSKVYTGPLWLPEAAQPREMASSLPVARWEQEQAGGPGHRFRGSMKKGEQPFLGAGFGQPRIVGCYFPGQKPQCPAARKLDVQMSAAVSPPWFMLVQKRKKLVFL